MADTTTTTLDTDFCPACDGMGDLDGTDCALCAGTGLVTVDPTPIADDVAAAIDADMADDTDTDAPAIRATRPVVPPSVRWRTRFGADADASVATAPAPAIMGIDPDRGLVNPCRAAGLMRAFVGTIIDATPVRANGNDYLLIAVDTGDAIVAARFGAHRVPPVGSVVYFRGTPLGADDMGTVRLSGPRSLRLRRDDDPVPGVHTY